MKSDKPITHGTPGHKGQRVHTKKEADTSTQELISKDTVSNNSPDLHSTISDEVLRSRIRELIEEKPAESLFKRFSTNPLAAVIIGFLLTGLIGGFLADYYNRKQKELETQRTNEQRESDRMREDQQRELDRKREDDKRESDRRYQERQKEIDSERAKQQRETDRQKDLRQKELEDQRSLQQRELQREKAFADAISKKRVDKIGEVWEQVYVYEAEAQHTFQAVQYEREKYRDVSEALDFEDDILQKKRKDERRTQGQVSPETEIAIKKNLDKFKKAFNEYDQATKSLFEKFTIEDKKLKDLLNRNRFWIGEESYALIGKYTNATSGYIFTDPKEEQKRELYLQTRESLRQTITQLEKQLLKQ